MESEKEEDTSFFFSSYSFDHDRHGNIPVTKHVDFLIKKDRAEACPQRTPIWYEKRKNHLTASSIASACGENKYDSRISCLRKKLGFGEPFTGNKATEHGNKYEDVAIELYEKQYKKKVIDFGLLESLNENEKFLAGSPDGITNDGILIEVKCPFFRTPDGQVPFIYTFQIQSLMRMLNLKECDFIEFVPKSTWKNEILQVIRVQYDPDFWKEYFPRMRRFWDDVEEIRSQINHGIFEEEKSIIKKRKYTKRKKTEKKNQKTLKIVDSCKIEVDSIELENLKLKEKELSQNSSISKNVCCKIEIDSIEIEEIEKKEEQKSFKIENFFD